MQSIDWLLLIAPLALILGIALYTRRYVKSVADFLLADARRKETDSSVDLRNDMIGTGPWMLTDYNPSVGIKLKRNPEYYDVLVLPNIYGDIVSDLGAGLIGGLGMAPGGNLSDSLAVFSSLRMLRA